MPRLIKYVKVKFDSFWMSGELELKERKALTFARNLRKNHEAFAKEVKWYGKWHGHVIDDKQLLLKVSFQTVYKPVVRKVKTYITYNIETLNCPLDLTVVVHRFGKLKKVL